MKKLISILFLTLIVILPLRVKALSVSNNNLTIETNKSKTVELYAEVDTEITEVNFSLIYTSYDVPAYFNIESGLRDETSGINHKIIFSVPVTGKIKLGTINIDVVEKPTGVAGSINVHSAKALTTEGETITLTTQMINVTIKKVENNEPEVNPEEDYPIVNENQFLLEKIESSLVKIDLLENVYEYTVTIDENVEELDLNPIVKDKKYTVEMTTQKISELEDNQIIITVKDGDTTEEYKIRVNVLKEIEKTEIDEEEFESTYKYKGKWITLIIILSIVLFVGLILNKKK